MVSAEMIRVSQEINTEEQEREQIDFGEMFKIAINLLKKRGSSPFSERIQTPDGLSVVDIRANGDLDKANSVTIDLATMEPLTITRKKFNESYRYIAQSTLIPFRPKNYPAEKCIQASQIMNQLAEQFLQETSSSKAAA